MTEVAIRCVSISKRFGAVHAVTGAHLSLARGRLLALLGPSGCGKTTVLRLLAGFELPDTGSIEIGGRVVVDNGSFVPPEKRKVGMVFQDYALFPHLDVAGNVVYGLPRSADRDSRQREILALVGLEGLQSRMPHELSGGQQQRVALARALVPRPDVVLLDEPFSNLDAALRTRLRGEVRRILKAAAATAVFVTHDREEALSLADEVAVMLDGRIVQVAEPAELYRCPISREVATLVGEADFLPGDIVDGGVACELGLLRSAGPLTGRVDVMLRPEEVELVPERGGPCEIIRKEFYGHDQMLVVRLPSGAQVRARQRSHARFSCGDRVRAQVAHEVVVFGRPSPPACFTATGPCQVAP